MGTLTPRSCRFQGSYQDCTFFDLGRAIQFFFVLEQDGRALSGHMLLQTSFSESSLDRSADRFFTSALDTDGSVKFSMLRFSYTPVPMDMHWSLKLERATVREVSLVGTAEFGQTLTVPGGVGGFYRVSADVRIPLFGGF